MEDIGFVLFSLFNVIWATLYLESWKRRSAELSYEWGTIDSKDEMLAEPRPLYQVTNSGIKYVKKSKGSNILLYISL